MSSTKTHSHTHAYMYMHIHMYMYTTDTLIHSCTDTHRSYAVTCAHTYTQTCACQQQTHACTHLHSYTQTHTCTVLVRTNIYTTVVHEKNMAPANTWSLSVVICCRWHYSCTDLGSMLQQNLVPMATVYTVLGLGFYSNPDPALRGFYVDEVSFSSVSRSLVDVSHANSASLFYLYLCKGGTERYILPE